jgi:hypothetical protein
MVTNVYAADRKSEQPEAQFGDFAGLLQVDSYGSYTSIPKRQWEIAPRPIETSKGGRQRIPRRSFSTLETPVESGSNSARITMGEIWPLADCPLLNRELS